MKNTKKKGFTIVELVIVIAVIAILAAVAIPTFSSVITKAKESNAMQAAKNAYTDYLAGIDYTTTTPASKICIKSGDFYFHVEDGVFNATPVENHGATTEEGYTPLTVD